MATWMRILVYQGSEKWLDQQRGNSLAAGVKVVHDRRFPDGPATITAIDLNPGSAALGIAQAMTEPVPAAVPQADGDSRP